MNGLMRGQFTGARRTAAAVVFVLALPFYEASARALPRRSDTPDARPGADIALKSTPANEAAEREENANIASAIINSGTGSVIDAYLRSKQYKRIKGMHDECARKPYWGKIQLGQHLAKQIKMFKEAETFEADGKLHIVLASLFSTADFLGQAKASEQGLVDEYFRYVGKYGSLGLASTVKEWVKNGRGSVIELYERMDGNLPKKR